MLEVGGLLAEADVRGSDCNLGGVASLGLIATCFLLQSHCPSSYSSALQYQLQFPKICLLIKYRFS